MSKTIEHNDTEMTPTSLRRLTSNVAPIRKADWRNLKLLNEWCEWRIYVESTIKKESK